MTSCVHSRVSQFTGLLSSAYTHLKKCCLFFLKTVHTNPTIAHRMENASQANICLALQAFVVVNTELHSPKIL